ncbi:MAG: hypothetical protein ABIH66_08100 [bacterium]
MKNAERLITTAALLISALVLCGCGGMSTFLIVVGRRRPLCGRRAAGEGA